MKLNTCNTCKHYIHHYVYMDNKFSPIMLGHCIFPRVKIREVTTKACEHYVQKQKEEN